MKTHKRSLQAVLAISFSFFLVCAGCIEEEIPPKCVTGEFAPYFGMFHSHTMLSDGEGTPQEAFAYARDQGALDVFALTDHREQLSLLKWGELTSSADAFYAPGSYVTLAGFEYGSGFKTISEPPFIVSTGHANVLFVEDITAFPLIDLNFHDFYNRLFQCPTCVGQFNHPADPDYTRWEDFAYDSRADTKMNLFELNASMPDTWPYLFEALDKGWHLSPTWNQDNHSPNWGTKDEHRTGLWLGELTREAVKSCFEDRRTFASLDRNASIRLISQNGCWMGSILAETLSAKLTVVASDPDEGDGFDSIQLWGPGQTLLFELDCNGDASCGEEEVDVNLSQAGYVLARANQTDGDVLVSSPIWLRP